MVEVNTSQLASPWARILVGVFLALFFSLDKNPVVRLEAVLGLSPSPLERFFGVKSVFSGMTEGIVRFMNLEIRSAFEANIFSPLVVPLICLLLVIGRVPQINSKRRECSFFASIIIMSVMVNAFN